jgi:hypothetical protein
LKVLYLNFDDLKGRRFWAACDRQWVRSRVLAVAAGNDQSQASLALAAGSASAIHR